MKVLIAVCAFNEEETVGKVVESLVIRGFDVLVINDGSHDNTRITAMMAGARVLTHLENFGQGASIKSAIDVCIAENWDAIVTVDADGQHDAKSVISITDAWLSDPTFDVVLGSRFLYTESHVPLIRKGVLNAAILFTRITTGLALTDTHNGLRVLSRKACTKLSLRQSRMAHASEILKEIKSKKLTWREYPVTIHYTSYSKAKGQRSFAGAVQILWDLVARGK